MKFCKRCNEERPLEEFAIINSKTGKLSDLCIIHKRERDREYWKINRDDKNKKKRLFSNIRKKNIQQFIINYLKQHPCVDCGNNDIRVLEFDHVKNKSHNISDLIRKIPSLETLKEEIEKCEIRCANCHKIKTFKNNNCYRNEGVV